MCNIKNNVFFEDMRLEKYTSAACKRSAARAYKPPFCPKILFGASASALLKDKEVYFYA